MKKIFMLSILLFFIFTICACSDNDIPERSQSNAESTKGGEQSQTVSTAEITTKITTDVTTNATSAKAQPPSGLDYVSGSIILRDSNYYDYGEGRPYRLIYYSIPGPFLNLVPNDEFSAWAEENMDGKSHELNEMCLVMFVKHFNIPRKDFEMATEKCIDGFKSVGAKINKDELFEVPNADVIYTFDNEIINRYYRYE